MTKTLLTSNSAAVLTIGDGGLLDQKPQPQPLSSLAQADTQKPSSASAQQERLHNSTPLGDPLLNNGKKNTQTEGKGSNIPNSTLAGTANWVLTLLKNRHLIGFVLNEAEGRYEAHFPVSTWKLIGKNVLTLAESEKEEMKAFAESEKK